MTYEHWMLSGRKKEEERTEDLTIRDHVAEAKNPMSLEGVMFISYGDCQICGESVYDHASTIEVSQTHDEAELRAAVERLSLAARQVLRPRLVGDQDERRLVDELVSQQDRWEPELGWMIGLLLATTDSDRQTVARLIDDMSEAES